MAGGAVKSPVHDAEEIGRSALLVGNFYYAHGRIDDAIAAWEQAGDGAPGVLFRNLAVAYINHRRDPAAARQAFDRAVAVDPDNGLLRYEHDQLRKHLADPPADRLAELLKHPRLVRKSNRLSAELCDLYVLTGREEDARRIRADRSEPGRFPRAWSSGVDPECIRRESDDPKDAFFLALSDPSARRPIATRLLISAEAAMREPVDESFDGTARTRSDVCGAVLTAMAQVLLGRHRQAIDLLDDVARIDPADMTAFAVRATVNQG